MSPSDQIRNARDLWGFAMFLHEAVEREAITRETFVRELKIDTDGQSFKIGQNYDRRTLDDLSYNLMLAALAVCVIQIDTALDQTFGPDKQQNNPSAAVAAARAIVYMLRCAFAHNPFEPRWEVRGNYYPRIWDIPGVGVPLDTKALDGQPLVPAQFGGWEGFATLVEYCLSLAK